MRKTDFSWAVLALLTLCLIVSCNSGATHNSRQFGNTLYDYARKAKQRGSRESLVPYAIDEEEGTMLVVHSIGEAIEDYEWIIGEPVDEKSLTIARATNSTDPDSIFTAYRFRVTKRLGRSKNTHAVTLLEDTALKALPIANNEIIVVKSGGDTFVDGVLLKKRGSPCFSELLPRPYLLGLAMDSSDRIGSLAMGCRSIFAINGDNLTSRDQAGTRVTVGMKDRFGNSLAKFSNAFENPPSKSQ